MSFPISYEIIYSKRKSVAIQIRPDGQVIVRAPYGCPRSFINSFIHQKTDWIAKHSAENKQRYEKQVQLKKDRPTLSDAQRRGISRLPVLFLRKRQLTTQDLWALLTAGSPSGSRRPVGEAAAARETSTLTGV